jgi:hypothetical protein
MISIDDKLYKILMVTILVTSMLVCLAYSFEIAAIFFGFLLVHVINPNFFD